MEKYMTREEIATGLVEEFKKAAKASGEDVTDTLFELSIDHKPAKDGEEEDDINMAFNVRGYDDVFVGLLTAHLMANPKDADDFLEAVRGLGDEETIQGIDVESQNHTFKLKLTVDEDLNPTVEFKDVTTGRLGVAMYILHEEYSPKAVMKVRDVLVGVRDKFEEGLLLTGEREPELKDALRQIIELLGKDVAE